MKGEDFVKNIQEFNNKYIEAVNLLMQKKLDTSPFLDMKGIQTAYVDAVTNFTNNPSKFFEHNLEYASKISGLMFHFMEKMTGSEPAPLYNAQARDKRFKDNAWQDSLYFNFVKQFYFMSSDWYRSLVKKLDVPDSQKKLLEFYTEQILNAASPTNFLNLNPEVLNELVSTNGKNLIQGIENFLNDIKHSDNILSITTAASEVFTLGTNIASTKGKVIMQNDLMQLICYEPKEEVHTTPILVIPPWINKYYILDLTKENSFIQYLVDKNYQVYLVSWVNPSSDLAHKNFEDYFKEGIDEPINFLKKTFGYHKFNLIGYCLGGTLATTAAAYYAAKKEDNIASLTLLTTLLDFSEPGDLGLFINEQTIESIKNKSCSLGYFSGKYMSHAFSLLRSNELIWSFVINNYLMGKKPLAFDLLYWNSDSTNLPAAMHDFYLDNMYVKNALIKAGGIEILNTPIDLSQITIDAFFLSTIDDHIAPWKSTYSGTKFFSEETQEKLVFCLAGSGHIAGVINPPTSKKYSYYTNEQKNKESDEWFNNATEHSGSWWNFWENWLNQQSGSMQKSIEYDKVTSLENAPGSYVKVRII